MRRVREWTCAACTASQKTKRNCDGRSNRAFRLALGVGDAAVVAHRCPWAELGVFAKRALRHYARYRAHGLLPRVGGTGEQDARLMQAFDVLDAEVARVTWAEAVAKEKG